MTDILYTNPSADPKQEEGNQQTKFRRAWELATVAVDSISSTQTRPSLNSDRASQEQIIATLKTGLKSASQRNKVRRESHLRKIEEIETTKKKRQRAESIYQAEEGRKAQEREVILNTRADLLLPQIENTRERQNYYRAINLAGQILIQSRYCLTRSDQETIVRTINALIRETGSQDPALIHPVFRDDTNITTAEITSNAILKNLKDSAIERLLLHTFTLPYDQQMTILTRINLAFSKLVNDLSNDPNDPKLKRLQLDLRPLDQRSVDSTTPTAYEHAGLELLNLPIRHVSTIIRKKTVLKNQAGR